MRRDLPRKKSLSRKITLLFSGAVLLTIVVTLAFPWIQMSVLTEQTLRIRAEQIATIAFRFVFEVGGQDWADAQALLRERWPVYQRQIPSHTGPVPQLLSLEEARNKGIRPGKGFEGDAIEFLTGHPNETVYSRFENDGQMFRLAMAVRTPATEPHPDTLRGIIDVKLPVRTDERALNWAVTVLGGALGAVLAILVFYMVTQRLVLSPVNTLRRVAEQVTGGDLNVRADIATGDEFQQLAQAFNEMLSHLHHVNRSLDIKLGELAETNVALWKANRLKSEFLTNVSHELRTPLASIIGFAELLRDAMDGPQLDSTRLRRYSENILGSGRSLLDIINDLLDLAKIEAGEMELHVSEFSLADVCEDSVDFIRPLADKKAITVDLKVDARLPRMHSDSGKVKQILYNLLSNAVKFTPTGGTVSLQAECVDHAFAVLHVRDTGPGIAPDQVPAIFEKFRQLDASKTREFEGTGLGLAITKELTQMLGGRISLESELGRGATFSVRLPTTAPSQ